MVKGRSSPWFLILFALIFLLPVYSFPGLSRKFSFNGLILSVGFDNYAVIFDAESTGSRVHVFRFDQDLNLLRVGKDFELLVTTTPGLSSYADDPKAAADSLRPLLQKAEAAVPKQLNFKTPLRLGVRELFKKESTLEYKAEWVSILEGSEEGAYLWVAINYLLGTLGKKYSSTVGVIDLGGGSVQMAYAIAKESAANAPVAKDAYVLEKNIVGRTYYVYSHSYLNYGLKAARAQSLKLSGGHGNPCVTNGYKGTYKYSGVIYNVSAPLSGTSLWRCRALTGEVLDAPCPYRNCSFDGVWNGGGGDGRKNLYVALFFYDTAVGASIIKQNVQSVKVSPIVYWNAAKVACRANVETIKSIFPQIDKRDVPFLCMDLGYEYTLLVHGFGIDHLEGMTVLKQVEYKGSLVEAAWPLGCAIEVLSSPSA